MATELVAGGVWPAVRRAAETAGPRHLAIAFVAKDAPRLLDKLCSRDFLVVNASDDAVRSHATSPEALAVFLRRGVKIRSVDDLHAKTIATSSTAVVGSANASRNSERSHEAAIITTQKSVVRGVEEFVRELYEVGATVDEAFVARAQRIWDESDSPNGPVPGVNGAPEDVAHLPDPVRRIGLAWTEPYEYDDADRAAMKAGRAQGRSVLGANTRFVLDSWRADVGSFALGDVVVLFGERRVWSPAVVVAVTPVEGADGTAIYTLRHLRDLTSLSLRAATGLLSESGIEDFRWDDRLITDCHEVSAILELWQLDGGP